MAERVDATFADAIVYFSGGVMNRFDFGPECEAILHVKRKSIGLELKRVKVRTSIRDEPKFLPGDEFGIYSEKQSDVIEAVAARMSGARVTIADIISDSDPVVIPFMDK